MGTLIASAVCRRGRVNRPGFHAVLRDPDDGHSPLCIICASIFCFTFAMTIFFSLKQEAVWAKFIVICIIVLSIILLCAVCRKNENKALPAQPSRFEFGTENVVKKDENKTLPVQPSRIELGKAKVVAFLKKIKTFLFWKKKLKQRIA